MSKYEISGKIFHIRFYENDSDKYSSSFQMVVDGNIGIIYGLNGAGFFRCIKDSIRGIMKDLNVDTIFFTMMADTLKFLNISLEGVALLEIIREVKAHDRDMLEIKLKLVEK